MTNTERDRASFGDAVFMVSFALASLVPFLLLWMAPTALPELISPLVTVEDLVRLVPKLSRDSDAIASRHFDYRPEPYLYAYFTALVASTALALALTPRTSANVQRPARKRSILKRRPRRIKQWIGMLAGLAMFLIWPWIGLSFIGDGRRGFPPGAFHDLWMIALLAMYGLALSTSPAMFHLWLANSRD